MRPPVCALAVVFFSLSVSVRGQTYSNPQYGAIPNFPGRITSARNPA